MPCSEKKRQANIANSAKSTGPRSKEGKAKVALNSLKHGLRSKEIVLPGEDAAAFDAMVAQWMDGRVAGVTGCYPGAMGPRFGACGWQG